MSPQIPVLPARPLIILLKSNFLHLQAAQLNLTSVNRSCFRKRVWDRRARSQLAIASLKPLFSLVHSKLKHYNCFLGPGTLLWRVIQCLNNQRWDSFGKIAGDPQKFRHHIRFSLSCFILYPRCSLQTSRFYLNNINLMSVYPALFLFRNPCSVPNPSLPPPTTVPPPPPGPLSRF